MDIFDLLGENFEDNHPRIKDHYEPSDLLGEDGYIDIPPFLWDHLNTLYDKHTIRDLLNRATIEHNLEPPFKIFSEKELWEDFETLCCKDVHSLLKNEKWYLPMDLYGISDNDLTYQGYSFFLGTCYDGLKSSDHFSQSERWRASDRYGRSMSPVWENKKMLYYIWNNVWGLKYDKVDRSIIRACLRNRKYMAGQFKPAIAKFIYETFQAKRVLDPSSGWGDRLSGFLASSCTEHYVGIDPNTKLHSCYQKQLSFFNTKMGKKADFICSGSEDADLSEYKEYFDLAFTSPPYFDTEKYSDENTQSIVKYPKFDDWIKGYYLPTLENCWNSLREGGRLIININDVYEYSDSITYYMCKPLFDYMKTLPNAHYEGAIGYGIAQRNSTRSNRSQLQTPLAEPIWVWCKGKAEKPLFLQNDLWF